MAHPAQKNFCIRVQKKYPQYFDKVKVLDVGSLDINGSNRFLFTNVEYTGIDLALGKNVDFVSKGHEWNAKDCSYDTIISTECFEHDMYYDKTLKNIVRMLKPEGLFLFTCASYKRGEHGTRRSDASSSPFTSKIIDNSWNDYYKNLGENEVCMAIDVPVIFKEYAFENTGTDLYFYGIKK